MVSLEGTLAADGQQAVVVSDGGGEVLVVGGLAHLLHAAVAAIGTAAEGVGAAEGAATVARAVAYLHAAEARREGLLPEPFETLLGLAAGGDDDGVEVDERTAHLVQLLRRCFQLLFGVRHVVVGIREVGVQGVAKTVEAPGGEVRELRLAALGGACQEEGGGAVDAEGGVVEGREGDLATSGLVVHDEVCGQQMAVEIMRGIAAGVVLVEEDGIAAKAEVDNALGVARLGHQGSVVLLLGHPLVDVGLGLVIRVEPIAVDAEAACGEGHCRS